MDQQPDQSCYLRRETIALSLWRKVGIDAFTFTKIEMKIGRLSDCLDSEFATYNVNINLFVVATIAAEWIPGKLYSQISSNTQGHMLRSDHRKLGKSSEKFGWVEG